MLKRKSWEIDASNCCFKTKICVCLAFEEIFRQIVVKDVFLCFLALIFPLLYFFSSSVTSIDRIIVCGLRHLIVCIFLRKICLCPKQENNLKPLLKEKKRISSNYLRVCEVIGRTHFMSIFYVLLFQRMRKNHSTQQWWIIWSVTFDTLKMTS